LVKLKLIVDNIPEPGVNLAGEAKCECESGF